MYQSCAENNNLLMNNETDIYFIDNFQQNFIEDNFSFYPLQEIKENN